MSRWRLISLMRRLGLLLLVLVVAYPLLGSCVYVSHLSRNWCNDSEFDPVSLGWHAAIWPLLVVYGDAFCD